MKTDGKLTNGGQIPAYNSEKTNDQIISELSDRNRKMRRCLNRILGSTTDSHVKKLIDELFENINNGKI